MRLDNEFQPGLLGLRAARVGVASLPSVECHLGLIVVGEGQSRHWISCTNPTIAALVSGCLERFNDWFVETPVFAILREAAIVA